MRILVWLRRLFRKKKRFGLIPQGIDKRDRKHKIRGKTKASMSLYDNNTFLGSQGAYNSCVAFATAQALKQQLAKLMPEQPLDKLDVSQAFIWYMTRFEEGTQNKNSGVVLRNAFNAIRKWGYVTNRTWSFYHGAYNQPSKFTIELAQVYLKTLPYFPRYESITGTAKTAHIRNAISNGNYVVLAIPVFESFEDYEGGVIREFTGKLKGYHAVVDGEYEEVDGEIIHKVMNWWGSKWGEKGYFRITDELLEKHAFDIWCFNNK